MNEQVFTVRHGNNWVYHIEVDLRVSGNVGKLEVRNGMFTFRPEFNPEGFSALEYPYTVHKWVREGHEKWLYRIHYEEGMFDRRRQQSLPPAVCNLLEGAWRAAYSREMC